MLELVGKGRESTGEEIWVVTGILLFTVSGFMVGHLNYNFIGMICRRVVTLLSVLVFFYLTNFLF